MICRAGDWLTAWVGDELVMMSVTDGSYLGLDAVGARVWELIEKPIEQSDLYEILTTEFDVSRSDCIRDVDSFLAALDSAGAVSRSSS